MSKKPADKPLRVRVSGGVLTIEIGVATLAHATLRSPYVFETMHDGASLDDIAKRFKITDTRGFARDVKCELLAEAEDGSSLLTNMLDGACREAIEQGAEHFIDTAEE